MSVWLLFGFLVAGLLNVSISKSIVSKYLGKNNFKSVLYGSLLGIPLPLCSCGVIPTGVAIYKSGASKSATVSFLISTPQTGVDSIMVTYSLLGWPFAVIRPLIALLTGIFGGALTRSMEREELSRNKNKVEYEIASEKKGSLLSRIFTYAFKDFLDDISKWLVIGLIIAALLNIIVPSDFFSSQFSNPLVQMLLILLASIPLYVCATGSVPIAAVLLLKGLSPGAVLVFLMAGPATNAATITVIGNSLGRKTLISYLISIISGAIIFGLICDYLLPRAWFLNAIPVLSSMDHQNHFIPYWLQITSSITFALLIFASFYRKFIQRYLKKNINMNLEMDRQGTIFKVGGMTCNHCKMNVENAINRIEGVKVLDIDLNTSKVKIEGQGHEDEIKSAVESIGYEFLGVD